jgi:hypothetical protein
MEHWTTLDIYESMASIKTEFASTLTVQTRGAAPRETLITRVKLSTLLYLFGYPSPRRLFARPRSAPRDLRPRRDAHEMSDVSAERIELLFNRERLPWAPSAATYVWTEGGRAVIARRLDAQKVNFSAPLGEFTDLSDDLVTERERSGR